MSDTVLTERHGDVLVVTLNRPERHNALNAELSHWLGDAIRTADDDGVDVIVLTGAGDKSFCAGADMLEMSGVEAGQADLPPPKQRSRGIQEVIETPLPVIAAINGYCYGGGARLAIDCDIRIASHNASFRLPGVEYGLVVGAATLPRLVGVSKAKEWILTARKFLANEAFEAGLVNSLHEPENLVDAAVEMAQMIAAHSTAAVRESKRVMDLATLDAAAVAAESDTNRELRGSPEQTDRFRNATRKVTGR